MNSKKYLNRLFLIGLVLIGLTGCTLKRPEEMAEDIAPLAPLVSAEQAEPTAQPPQPATGDRAAQLAAALETNNPAFDWNGDGVVNVVDVMAAANNFPKPGAGVQAQQAGNAILKIEPGTQQINVGESTTAEIWVQDVENLAAVDIEIRFDPALLQVTDGNTAKEGIQIVPGEFLAADFVVRNDADNATGVIRYTVTQVAPTPPVSGSGVLAVIFFEAVAPGSSQVSFRVAQLASGEAQEILAVTRSSDIIVTQPGTEPATPPPTATPITGQPTATATPIIPGATAVLITATPTVPVVAEVQATATPTETPTPLPTATFTPVPPPQALIIDRPLVYIPPNATFGQCYRVSPEDTIETIAMFFGTTPQAINLANDLYPPYVVQRYQHIFVPLVLGNGPNVYQLQPGDSLSSVAEACNLPATMLARVNGLDIDKLPSGENTILQTDSGGLQLLIIPIPPYPPPARYQYPSGPIPYIPYQPPYPINKNHPPSPYN